MIIKFQIIKSVIVEAVKAATYLKGKIDEAAVQPGQRTPYFETAGDDEVHERTLDRDFITALEKAKTIFVDYLVPTSQTIGNNVIYYDDKTDDIVEFSLNVSRRYNGSLTDTLARLVSKYVEDSMCYEWWLKIGNLTQAAPYQTALASDEIAIRRCFVLSGPVVPTVKFPTSITAKVDGTDAEGEITLRIGEDATVSYSLNDGSVDDIEARSEDVGIVSIERFAPPKTFVLYPLNTGVAKIRLFSRHSDKVYTEFTVIVSKEYY